VQELLVDRFVTAAAISGRQFRGDHEAVMIFLFLAGGGLVAVQAVHTLPGMSTDLVFVNNGILRPRMTFRTLSGGTNQIRARLVGFNRRSGAIDEESSQNQGKRDEDGHKHRSKRHGRHLLREIAVYRTCRGWKRFNSFEAKDEPLAHVVEVPHHRNKSDADCNDQTRQAHGHSEEDPLKTIHLPRRNSHKNRL
jgi:hypothetical protein